MDTTIRSEANSLSIASLVLGIISLLSAATMLSVPFFGGLSITIGLLSRGRYKMHSTAIVGIVLSVISFVVSIGTLALVINFLMGADLNALFYSIG